MSTLILSKDQFRLLCLLKSTRLFHGVGLSLLLNRAKASNSFASKSVYVPSDVPAFLSVCNTQMLPQDASVLERADKNVSICLLLFYTAYYSHSSNL